MITYPVDTSKRFTFIKDGVPNRGKVWPNLDGSAIEGAESGVSVLEELPLVQATLGANQKYGPLYWVDDVVNQTATPMRDAVDMTVEEIAAVVENNNRDIKRVNAANAVSWLRARSVEASGVSVSSGNVIQVTQAVVDNLATFYDRFADFLEGNRFDEE